MSLGYLQGQSTQLLMLVKRRTHLDIRYGRTTLLSKLLDQLHRIRWCRASGGGRRSETAAESLLLLQGAVQGCCEQSQGAGAAGPRTAQLAGELLQHFWM